MIQQIDLTRSIDFNPMRTIEALSRVRSAQDQETQQNALQLQRLAQQIQESKRKADAETAVKAVLSSDLDPEEKHRQLQAIDPAVAESFRAEKTARQVQARNIAKDELALRQNQPAETRTVGQPGMAVNTPKTPPGEVATISSPVATSFEQELPVAPVVIPGVNGTGRVAITPRTLEQNAREAFARKRAETGLATQAKIEETAAAARAKASEPFSLPQGETRYGPDGNVIASNAPKKTPGVDVPFPVDVQAQKIKIALAEKVDPTEVKEGTTADGKPGFFLVDKKTGTVKQLADIAPKVPTEKPPAAVQQTVSVSDRALQQTQVIRKILDEHPEMVGPIMGRLDEFAQGIGKNPFAGDAKLEQLGATLTGHLRYLFAQELKNAIGGRPGEFLAEQLKQASPQRKQDINLLNGFLDSVENNANISINSANDQYPGYAPFQRVKRGGSASAAGTATTGIGANGNIWSKDATGWHDTGKKP